MLIRDRISSAALIAQSVGELARQTEARARTGGTCSVSCPGGRADVHHLSFTLWKEQAGRLDWTNPDSQRRRAPQADCGQQGHPRRPSDKLHPPCWMLKREKGSSRSG
ncbi:hypothetical protein NDU88_006075 [Pleurodeles waltl]|uniref:Uncharacterized protein n=1 Tax=Pleurodeles waltl TaxID=8319 RepID=A0AAV7TWK7_PLEWA|nr:hypothetical protein NDU88_006075 [Pleurodeles waltl]